LLKLLLFPYKMGNAHRLPQGPITAKRIDMIENETRITSLPPTPGGKPTTEESSQHKHSHVSPTPDKQNTINSTSLPTGKRQLHPSIRIRATAVSMQGWRHEMEDAHEIIPMVNLPTIGPAAFFLFS